MKKALIALTAALCLTGPTGGGAETYVVAVEAIDYFPHYRGTSIDYTGIARDVLDAFAAAEGHRFTYHPLPVRRLFADFLGGKHDFKYPDNPMWSAGKREGIDIAYSGPVVPYQDGISVLPANLGKGIDALKSIAIVRGFTAFELLDRINAGSIQVSQHDDFSSLIRFTLAGRADGAYGNRDVIQHRLREDFAKPGGLVFDADLPSTTSAYHLSTLKHPALIARFDAWMAENRGFIAAAQAKYGID